MMRRPFILAVLFASGLAAPVLAHTNNVGITGKKLLIRGEPTSSTRMFMFKSVRDLLIDTDEDPAGSQGAALLVQGLTCTAGTSGDDCVEAGSTGLITLDPQFWSPLGNPPGDKGYKYSDPDATAGGVKKIIYKDGKLIIKALGANWPWAPDGARDKVRVHFRSGDQWYCAEFGGEVVKNEAGMLYFKNAPDPLDCAPICGNGTVELGEECDDGNSIPSDGCEADCTIGDCIGQSYNSTFEAIQSVIFENRGCTNNICHGSSMQGGLDLTPANAHANIVNVPSSVDPARDRIEPGDQNLSIMWLKLAENTLGDPNIAPGGGMPVGGALTTDELEAMRLWIRAGAPLDTVVEGTASLLSSCLPPTDPQKIPQPDPPPAGTGTQIIQTPYPLNSQQEREICMATYYDWTAPGLVPASAKFACPWGATTLNPSGECIKWHKQILYQDPQSHHSILHMYLGSAGTSDPGWGGWTYKSGPNTGMSCDPTAIDATGINPGCSTAVVGSVACIGFGPSDFGLNSPLFNGAQEPLYVNEFADGVYSVMPIRGMVAWNSHAFNLTDTNTTMDQYLNIFFAEPADQLYQAQVIFDNDDIFVQNVLPFQTAEYCDEFIIPTGSNLFHLSSHMHKRGVLFRIWAPPNSTSCFSGCTPPAGTPTYTSTDYTYPVQLYFDPPVTYSGDTAQRRFVYCARYDNGATDIQDVKRRSTSPPAFIGGPCAVSETRCIGGPNHNALCNGNNSVCDSSPGAGDGDCDACPLRGGFTTEDEMMIMLGTYY